MMTAIGWRSGGATRPSRQNTSVRRLVVEALAGAVGAVLTAVVLDRIVEQPREDGKRIARPLRFATSFVVFRFGMTATRAILSRVVRAT